MAKDKPETRIRSTNASAVSIQMIRAWERIMITWIKAGESNFLSGYSSNIAITDFMFNAGLISKQAMTMIELQSSIISGITDFSALLGQSQTLTPQMKSRVEQNTERGGREDDGEDDEVQAAISSLATQALAGALEVAAVA